MQYKDYYKVLGVKPDAKEAEIKQAFKKLAVKYHPDANPGNASAEKRFKEISEAKEILLDKEHRFKYDQLRYRYEQMRRAGMRPNMGGGQRPPQQEEVNSVFSSFFDEVFGGGGGNRARRGKNQEAHVKITMEEAYKGMEDILQWEGKKIRLKLKPGIRHGQKLRVKGRGGAGRNGG
ncbi:MAG: DnaJ domain-containing protein, partial [Bacteroidota bacterium]